jgi:hypothetical protein
MVYWINIDFIAMRSMKLFAHNFNVLLYSSIFISINFIGLIILNMKKLMLVGAVAISMISSCSSSKKTSATNSQSKSSTEARPFIMVEVSTDSTYGYTETNAIHVGGMKTNEGPSNQRRFLNRLRGPKGEEIKYRRLGSCCPFKSDNGFMGSGLLDKYEVTWAGQDKPVILFIDFYEYGPLKAPVGFTLRDY